MQSNALTHINSEWHTYTHAYSGYIRQVARIRRGYSPDSGTDLYLRGKHGERLTLEPR